jgi:hypothetical protein
MTNKGWNSAHCQSFLPRLDCDDFGHFSAQSFLLRSILRRESSDRRLKRLSERDAYRSPRSSPRLTPDSCLLTPAS